MPGIPDLILTATLGITLLIGIHLPLLDSHVAFTVTTHASDQR